MKKVKVLEVVAEMQRDIATFIACYLPRAYLNRLEECCTGVEDVDPVDIIPLVVFDTLARHSSFNKTRSEKEQAKIDDFKILMGAIV